MSDFFNKSSVCILRYLFASFLFLFLSVNESFASEDLVTGVKNDDSHKSVVTDVQKSPQIIDAPHHESELLKDADDFRDDLYDIFPENGSELSLFTSEQEIRIGELIEKQLLTHPEILIQVSDELLRRQEEKSKQMQLAAVLSHFSDLTAFDSNTPVIGPESARVNVFIFSDYLNETSHRLEPELMYAIRNSSDVRFWFREWPVLATRWPISITASSTGLQVWNSKGIKGYLAYRNALFSQGHVEGELSESDIRNASFSAGIPKKTKGTTDNKKFLSVLSQNDVLAHQMRLENPPVIIVMPNKGATVENTTVISGMVTAEQLHSAIIIASGEQYYSTRNKDILPD